MCRSRGRTRMQHRQTPQCCRKSASSVADSGLHISRALLWFGGLDRTAPRRKARRGEGWERPPPLATLCVAGERAVLRVVLHANLPARGGRSHRNYPCGKAARRAALDHNPGRGRGADRRP